jgi:zinc protease
VVLFIPSEGFRLFVAALRLRSVLTMLRVGLVAAILLAAPDAASAALRRAAVAPGARSPAGLQPHVQRLANGFRYVIVPRRSRAFEDSARVSLRMHVQGGWLAETAGERGLAHLIEHMAMDANGELSAAQVVKMRDELTVAPEWGAWTSPEATEYFLSSQSNDVATIDRLMLYLAGISKGMKFDGAAVDRQRQSVANEMAPRRQGDLRLYERAHRLAPGSPLDLAQGYVSTDVATASLETIGQVYRRIYRPENVTLVIVGDFDPADMEGLVRKHFGAWAGGADAAVRSEAARSYAPVAPDRAPVSFDRAPVGPPAVLLSSAAPIPHQDPGNEPRPAGNIVDRLISTAVNQRLEIAALQEGLAKAAFSIRDDEPNVRTVQWEAVPDGNEWQPALDFLLHERALADAYGFSDRDVGIAKRRLLRQLADERDWAAYATNAQTAERVGGDILRGLDPLPPELAYKRDSEALEKIDAAQVNLEWRRISGSAPLQVRVESEGLARLSDPASRILQALDNRKKRDAKLVNLPAPKPAKTLAYRSGRAGAIKSDNSLPEGVRRVTFANNVVLSLISRRHEGKWLEIAVDVDAPSARLRLTRCDSLALPLFVASGGSVEQSATQMREAIMNSDLRLAPFYASAAGIATSASVRKEDVGSAIPFLFELVAEPGFRPSGTKAARALARSAVASATNDPAWAALGAAEGKLAALRSGRDLGFDLECVDRASMAKARRLIGAMLSQGRIEIAVAGNFDEKQVIALVASTFGTVPARQPARVAQGDADGPALPPVKIDAPRSAAPQAVYGALWDLGPAGKARERAVQQIFATSFSRSLYTRLVEQSGLSYAPRAERVELREWFDRPVLFAASAVPRDRLKQMTEAAEQVAYGMTEASLDPALLELARHLSLDGLRASYNEDRVWAYQAVQLGRRPDAVRIWRQTEGALSAVTADEIRAFAQKSFARQLLTINPGP